MELSALQLHQRSHGAEERECLFVLFRHKSAHRRVTGLAREVGKDRITVNALAPGFTLSENVAKDPAHMRVGEISKASRAIQRDEVPEDLVGAVSFLASDDAAFITGQTLVVDGGSAMI